MAQSTQAVSTARRGEDPARGDTPTGWRGRIFVPTLVLIGLVGSMLSSLGAPLIPTIARSTDVNLSTAQWLLTSTQLVGAVAAPIMAQLADGRHRRHIIIWGLVVVLIGSVVAATAHSFGLLIVGRTLQGVGIGLVPVAIVIARNHLPGRRSTNAIAVLSIATATGLGLGWPLTGFIAQYSDYHVAFWVAGGLVVIALALLIPVLPRHDSAPPTHLDLVGSVLFTIALVALLIAISQGEDWGWVSPPVLGLVVVAIVVTPFFIRHELHVERPLIVLAQLRIPVVLLTNIVIAIIGVAMYMFLPILVEFVQIPRSEGFGFGESVFIAGLTFIPMSVGTVLGSPVMRYLRDRYGARLTMTMAQVLFGSGLLFFVIWHAALWQSLVTMGLCGLAVGIGWGAMPGFIVAAVPASQVGAAMGLYQVSRNVGLTAGSALGGLILAINTAPGHTVPSVNGYLIALGVGAGLSAILLPVCLLYPSRPKRYVPAVAPARVS